MPLLTYRVLSKIPNLVTLGGVLLGGIWWITNRREEVAKAERERIRPLIQWLDASIGMIARSGNDCD